MNQKSYINECFNYFNLEKWQTIKKSVRCKFEIVRAGLHYGGEVHWSWKKGRFLILIGRKSNS